MSIYENKAKPALSYKKSCLIEQCYRHCSATAIYFFKVNFILSISCNNSSNLKVTLQFPLAKGPLIKPNFNGNNIPKLYFNLFLFVFYFNSTYG